MQVYTIILKLLINKMFFGRVSPLFQNIQVVNNNLKKKEIMV
jgi:hypothetical protein